MAYSKTISVLGCGWLGWPLARYFVQQGWQVKGSTTTPEKYSRLKLDGIEPFVLRSEPILKGERTADFFESAVLFLNIPFRRQLPDPSFYFQQITSVIGCLEKSPVRLVVFASSTSVYAQTDGRVEENGAIAGDPRSRALYAVEQALLTHARFDATIIRFAGLYGGSRRIGQFLAGKRDVPDPDGAVNLIHLDDAVAVSARIIEKDVRRQVFNACSDGHPARRELYTKAAQSLELPPPVFQSIQSSQHQKIVSNVKVKQRLSYTFSHPDPMLDI